MRPEQPLRQYRAAYGRRRPLRKRFGGLGVAATAAIALLTIVVVVLAVRLAGDGGGAARGGETTALRADLLRLETELAGLRKTVRDLARQALADLDRTAKLRETQAKRTQLLATCLPQLQNQIDDLQAYLAYGRQPRRNRVSAPCARLVRPEFSR